jgi:hypothetical protein
MRLVLHIGLHKTASTAFQTLCRDNAALLAIRRILACA